MGPDIITQVEDFTVNETNCDGIFELIDALPQNHHILGYHNSAVIDVTAKHKKLSQRINRAFMHTLIDKLLF